MFKHVYIFTVVFAADIAIFPCASGIDSEGHAANFVETEQIVQYSNARASFVQVGGNYCWPLLQEYLFLTSQNSPLDISFVCSHSPLTQTRGSMPFFWSQRPNLRYKPKPLISTDTNHVRPFILLQQLYFYFNYQKMKKSSE